jgi:hypothetical protein
MEQCACTFDAQDRTRYLSIVYDILEIGYCVVHDKPHHLAQLTVHCAVCKIA